MGLDMYLFGTRFIGSSGFFPCDEVAESPKLEELRAKYGFERISGVKFSVAQWRKANAIHRWFVETVQNGNDDCGNYAVSLEQLETLVNMCKIVLAARDSGTASKVLPTTDGFFFGDTEYGEWYYQDLQYTVDTLEPLLSNKAIKDDWIDFEYRSSW